MSPGAAYGKQGAVDCRWMRVFQSYHQVLAKTVILLSFVRGVCSGGTADEDDGITGCLSLVMLIFSCSHPRLRVF